MTSPPLRRFGRSSLLTIASFSFACSSGDNHLASVGPAQATQDEGEAPIPQRNAVPELRVQTGPVPAGNATKRERGHGKRGLSSSEVETVVDANRHEIDACYAQYADQNAARAGRIDLHVEIHGDGLVHAPEIIRDDIEAAGLSACVLAHVSSWQFPRFEGEGKMKINIPFALNPPR